MEQARCEAILGARPDPVNRLAKWLGLRVFEDELIPYELVRDRLLAPVDREWEWAADRLRAKGFMDQDSKPLSSRILRY